MNNAMLLPSSLVFAICFFTLHAVAAEVPEPTVEPKIINPGPPPSDAIILFDGKSISKWESAESGEAKWKIKDGAMTVNGTGSIRTKEGFGDCQLHVEWASPIDVEGEGQGRGNSGIYFQGRYEIQVLDSYENKTYFHGQAGSLYKQHAPLVNAARRPGQWQTYDIIFHAPRFAGDGKLISPGRVTVLHNGVLIQDNVEILGTTSHVGAPKYEPHPIKQPLQLQDHKNPVRYRNIWIRPL
ncbi:MAG: DUF1080 domain-containing protein [Verrucomicrobiota bacterium]